MNTEPKVEPKPDDCTCLYPEMLSRNMTLHEKLCPAYHRIRKETGITAELKVEFKMWFVIPGKAKTLIVKQLIVFNIEEKDRQNPLLAVEILDERDKFRDTHIFIEAEEVEEGSPILTGPTAINMEKI